MKAATIDNVNIGAGWVPVLDPSCTRSRKPQALTLDFTTKTERDVHVTAEVAWSSLRGRAQVEVDVPVVLCLRGPCVGVRAKSVGAEAGAAVSVSAQLLSCTNVVPTQPTYTERVPVAQATAVAPVPHWAHTLHFSSVNPFADLFTRMDLLADAAGNDVLGRKRLNAPVTMSSRARWRRFVDADADLLLVWTLRL